MVIENRLYSPKEVITKNGGIIAISLSALYAAINNGEIPVRVVGKRKLIPGWFLKELITKKPVDSFENNKGGVNNEMQ